MGSGEERNMRINIYQPIDKFLRLRYECSKIHIVCCRWSHGEKAADRELSVGVRLTWSLARTLTGWLRSQPDWRIHPRAALASTPGLRLAGRAIAWKYDSIEARRGWLVQRLRQLSQDLRDIRAITSSREMSSTIGRYEFLLRAVLARLQDAPPDLTVPAFATTPALMRQRGVRDAEVFWAAMHDWPFLAV